MTKTKIKAQTKKVTNHNENKKETIREIPYNYTSLSDKEIVERLLGKRGWEIIAKLRKSRVTGVSASMFFKIFGDMWVILRNPYLQDDLLKNPQRKKKILLAWQNRLSQTKKRINQNNLALELHEMTSLRVKNFSLWLDEIQTKRKKIFSELSKVTRKDNIDFGGLARVSHVTDATDWRVEYPFVVLTPENEEEVARVTRICIELGLSIIPVGGATGYTGSSIPLSENCAVINTEKLDFIHPLKFITPLELETEVPTIEMGAGTVTKRIAEAAEAKGYVFAVDPTSHDASTIGGNIAMNAGGKKAVLWGTALDNLISWKMIMPNGLWVVVERLHHNLEKIHDQELVRFKVTTFLEDESTLAQEPYVIEAPGADFRKKGLGKDVTNKFLFGIPGIQKEGCDGIITSAVMLLHKMPKYSRTFCLEFFGNDVHGSVMMIVQIIEYIKKKKDILLAGLEHLDERYIRAVGYNTKGSRAGSPKMVLLGDIVGEKEKDVVAAASHIIGLTKNRNAEGFVAVSPQAQKNFWADRSRTAAIAAHTNAFKINEDVVIPLERLADYNEGIERINIIESTKHKIEMALALKEYLQGNMPELHKLRSYLESEERDVYIQEKVKAAIEQIDRSQQAWQLMLDSLEERISKVKKIIEPEVYAKLNPKEKLMPALLRRDIRISYRKDITQPLREIFSGTELEAVRKKFDAIHKSLRSGRLFVALHMHAGDGNVHTNIPVHSNDYNMMKKAEKIVDQVMELALSLDGVISGEHGIGLTKIQYLEKEKIQDFLKYKKEVDPSDIFNPGKLNPHSDLSLAYTPSLSLVEQEALIMEQSELGKLNKEIASCLRCGKCKPVCNTHIPRANLLYSPRNKILATGLIIEAFLYEEQTRRGISIQHFEALNDVADHCTICHKCYNPCPVNIDFGDVSIMTRNILKYQNKKKTNIPSELAGSFLTMESPTKINIVRQGILKNAFWAQNIGHSFVKNSSYFSKYKTPEKTTSPINIKKQMMHSLKKPLPILKGKALRSALGLEETGYISIVRDPQKTNGKSEAVFFFPGCGAERLYSQVGMAALAMLYALGVQTVLPPAYVCCGYPQISTGNEVLGQKITTDNRVLFHQVANTLNYLEIKTVLIICGTCLHQLETYQFEKIFKGSRLIDIHEFLAEKNIQMNQNGLEKKYLYHDPCHKPIKTKDAQKLVSEIMQQDVMVSDRCCGEAGTLAISRPDISTQVRFRKEEELKKNLVVVAGKEKVRKQEVELLTTCPACVQGLSRYRDTTGLKTRYVIEAVVESHYGKNWEKDFVQKIKNGGIEKVLL